MSNPNMNVNCNQSGKNTSIMSQATMTGYVRMWYVIYMCRIYHMNQSHPNITSYIQSYRDGDNASSHVTFPHSLPPVNSGLASLLKLELSRILGWNEYPVRIKHFCRVQVSYE